MFIINFCINMFRASLCPSLGEQRPCVTAYGVLLWFCWIWLVAVVGRWVVGCEQCSHPTAQRPTTATNHIQQNQNNTPNAVTGSWTETFIVVTSCKTAPHNRYQPHPAEPEQHAKCSNMELNRNHHNDHILQDSAPQPLPTTSSRTRTTHQMQ